MRARAKFTHPRKLGWEWDVSTAWQRMAIYDGRVAGYGMLWRSMMRYRHEGSTGHEGCYRYLGSSFSFLPGDGRFFGGIASPRNETMEVSLPISHNLALATYPKTWKKHDTMWTSYLCPAINPVLFTHALGAAYTSDIHPHTIIIHWLLTSATKRKSSSRFPS